MKVSKLFYEREWMLGTSGNLSVLITEPTSLRAHEPKKNFEFLITASGRDKGELAEEDFILVNEESESWTRGHVDTLAQKPSTETLLHTAIYKHTNAKVVFHVHTTNSTLLSMKSKDYILISGLEMLKGLGLKTHETEIMIPVIENNQNMKYLSEVVPSYINENIPGLVLKGHGIYAWGKSIEETKKHIEIFEFLFEYRVKELSVDFKKCL